MTLAPPLEGLPPTPTSPEAVPIDPTLAEEVSLSGLAKFVHGRREKKINELEEKEADASAKALRAEEGRGVLVSPAKKKKISQGEAQLKAVSAAVERINARAEAAKRHGDHIKKPQLAQPANTTHLRELQKKHGRLHPSTPHKEKAKEHSEKIEKLKKRNEKLAKRKKASQNERAIRKQDRYIKRQLYKGVAKEQAGKGTEVVKRGAKATGRAGRAVGRKVAKATDPERVTKRIEKIFDGATDFIPKLAERATPHYERSKTKRAGRKEARRIRKLPPPPSTTGTVEPRAKLTPVKRSTTIPTGVSREIKLVQVPGEHKPKVTPTPEPEQEKNESSSVRKAFDLVKASAKFGVKLSIQTTLEASKIGANELFAAYRRGEVSQEDLDNLLREQGVSGGLEALAKGASKTIDNEVIRGALKLVGGKLEKARLDDREAKAASAEQAAGSVVVAPIVTGEAVPVTTASGELPKAGELSDKDKTKKAFELIRGHQQGELSSEQLDALLQRYGIADSYHDFIKPRW